MYICVCVCVFMYVCLCEYDEYFFLKKVTWI